jgi:thiol-disulfide isomerase/thioredoxin
MKSISALRLACLAALAAACGQAVSSTTPSSAAYLNDLGPAPELHNTVWLNTAGPLTLAGLRGQVVLLNMWTFECINCQHVLPYVRAWFDRYHAQGLEVIGNHYPEFPFEASIGNLKIAVQQEDLRYPIAQDNNGQTWNAYHTRYWPTIYLIDKHGHLRYETIGEGAYDQTEAAIQALLAES